MILSTIMVGFRLETDPHVELLHSMSNLDVFAPDARPAFDEPRRCKICAARSALFGAVDFSKNCEERNGQFLPDSGIPVYFYRCQTCGFTFADMFDQWTSLNFFTHIYNEEYVKVDPEFVTIRPQNMARFIASLFDQQKASISVLDYGGGEGMLADLLDRDGYRSAVAYDPFGTTTAIRPAGQYDLITCFEVMEHVPDPLGTVADMAGFLKAEGVIVFSTLLQPKNFDQIKLEWWYASPRNGHISLFSRSALKRAWASVEFQCASLNANLHMAFKTVPDFARHLVNP